MTQAHEMRKGQNIKRAIKNGRGEMSVKTRMLSSCVCFFVDVVCFLSPYHCWGVK